MDKKIIKQMKNHNEISIELLKSTYLPFILYILKSFQLSHEDQEECINDILLKIWKSIDSYNEEMSLKNYIALITRRVGLNYIRKNKQNPLPYEDMDIFGTVDYYENYNWSAIIKKLKPNEKILFYKHYYYFQSIETIALELGMTYKSIESRLYRLRKKLQKLIKEEGYDG